MWAGEPNLHIWQHSFARVHKRGIAIVFCALACAVAVDTGEVKPVHASCMLAAFKVVRSTMCATFGQRLCLFSHDGQKAWLVWAFLLFPGVDSNSYHDTWAHKSRGYE